jgi:hypothetical protein
MRVVGGRLILFNSTSANISQDSKMNKNEITVPSSQATGFNVREKSQEKTFQATFGAKLLGKLLSNLRHESDMALFVRVHHDTFLSVCVGGGRGLDIA